jgi:hypothetical protein
MSMRTAVLAAVLAMSAVVGGAAQQGVGTVIVTLSEQQRNAGVYLTPSWTVPADAIGTLNIRAEIPTADYEEPTNRLVVRIYALLEDGTWRRIGGNDPDGWTGGRLIGLDGTINPPHEFGIGVHNYRGRQLRGEVEVFTRMRVGATLYTYP